MLINQTAEKLRSMRLPTFAAEYLRQTEMPGMDALSFDERLGMLTDAEWTARHNNRIKRLVTGAKLRISNACFADLDYRPSRKLDRAYIARLSDLAWIRDAKNILITGATGTGKTWLACAFGNEACRRGFRVAYYRVNRLLDEMISASGSADLAKLLTKLKKAELLILDDWGLSVLNPREGRLLLEVFEERYSERSTLIAAQLPVSKWHAVFEDPTTADAALDRVVHHSYRFELQGPSLRRRDSAVADGAHTSSPAEIATEVMPTTDS